MAVAKSNSNSNSRLSFQPCNCYKVASLTKTILDTNQTSNLKDRYVLGEQLGWGQSGVIRECSDKLTGEVLACKSIAKDRLVTLDDVWSIKLEIEIMTRLSGHPNVVDLKAVYEEEDYVHLVMELCAGGELFHQLEKHGRFSEAEARVLFRHLIEVVMYCHDNGVVHRDLKPENILLATKAASSPIKLADFGLATYIKPGQNLHGTVGSPFYIAPEVLAGGYNQAADLWSLGVILYILLSGRPPFWGKTKSRIFYAVRAADLRFSSDPWDHISESAKDLIRGMLCTDPSQRLTVQQVLDHSWMRVLAPVCEEPCKFEKQNCGELDFNGGSFSTSFMARNQDISFGSGSPLICDAQSPTFSCRSSFSSFLVDPSTPCLESGGFSFCSSGGSNTLEFSAPVLSMPSFAFFSPGSVAKQDNYTVDFPANICRVDVAHKGNSVSYISTSHKGAETSMEKLFALPDSSLCFGQEAREMEHKATEVKRLGGTSGSRMSGIHSKRNRTIGFGEFEQLDIMTESVIRWASCTHLPTTTSLRFSTKKPTHLFSNSSVQPKLRIQATTSSSSNNQNQTQPISTTTQIQIQTPKADAYSVKFKTLGGCKLGISRYPDFEYNADGGSGTGKVTEVVDNDFNGEISVNFDLETLYIPPLMSTTTRFLGLPLPPFLKIGIAPELFQGRINQESGKVDLEFKAKFLFSIGSVYKAPPLVVETVLTTEESKGTLRSGRGERLDEEGKCRLVGVATVEPINDFLLNSFLGLPTECLANLNAIISLSHT
ncbi:hypothetical protein F0562_026563 [Nyssa sinensis]|uniref:Protein kinase domain-containing protein n=1 Tax=Nyssa sinensis TaxID=561372 RepID=A0A5J5BFC5_9ASTE|nr:hypothetical protein F0562_026563 [Nyssa sinensis]